MLRIVAMLFILFFGINSYAQCPYVTGALIDGWSSTTSPTPSTEGRNEFVGYTTGTTPLAINSFSVGYGTTAAATTFTIDGATVSWLALTSFPTPAITNSAGTITNITTGSIPANTPFVIINSQREVAYDLKGFGPNVYVLLFNTGTGVSGYSATGNYANKSSPSALRYFRITAGACTNVVSYDKNSPDMSSADGAGAMWSSAGDINFMNTGFSGAVLPVNLISANAYREKDKTILKWETAGNSSAVYFEIEKSLNGSSFTKVGKVIAESAQFVDAKTYSFNDEEVNEQAVFYRLRLIDIDNSFSFSPVMRLGPAERQSSRRSRIFPNPASSQITIETVNNDNYNYVIKDFSGKVLIDNNFSGGTVSINIETLPSGFYFLQLIGSSDIETHKIIRE